MALLTSSMGPFIIFFMPNINPTSRQMRYFNLAKSTALNSEYTRKGRGKIAIGSAIVSGNFVVSQGYNKRKTHTRQAHHNNISKYFAPCPNIHAEMDALIRSRYHDLDGAEIFVYREFVDGGLANCRPCRSCMDALVKAGVKHIYYTDEDGFHYERV